MEAPGVNLAHAPQLSLVKAPQLSLVEAPQLSLVEAPRLSLVEAPSFTLVEALGFSPATSQPLSGGFSRGPWLKPHPFESPILRAEARSFHRRAETRVVRRTGEEPAAERLVSNALCQGTTSVVPNSALIVGPEPASAGGTLLASKARSFRRSTPLALIAAAAMLLSACGGHKKTTHNLPPPPTITPAEVTAPPSTSAETDTGIPTTERHGKVLYVETGMASWYGPPYHNRRGANGEIYDQNAMTAAHRTLPLNSIVRVTNLTTGPSVMVRITDRGPFVEDRIVDLSLAAAKAVDVWQRGHGRGEARSAVDARVHHRRRPLVRADWRLPQRAAKPAS